MREALITVDILEKYSHYSQKAWLILHACFKVNLGEMQQCGTDGIMCSNDVEDE
jgi:hypothetical protein